MRPVKEMALAVEWLPEEWPDIIPSLKQLLVVTPLTASILLYLAVLKLKLMFALDWQAAKLDEVVERRSIETNIGTVL